MSKALRWDLQGPGPGEREIPLRRVLPCGVECRLPEGTGEQARGESDLAARVAARLRAAGVEVLAQEEPGPTFTLDVYTPPGTGVLLAVARLFAMVTFEGQAGLAALWSTSLVLPLGGGAGFPEQVRAAADVLVDAFLEDLG